MICFRVSVSIRFPFVSCFRFCFQNGIILVSPVFGQIHLAAPGIPPAVPRSARARTAAQPTTAHQPRGLWRR
jgi:hypothetical protein